MPLTTADRKFLMPYGAQRDVAFDQGVKESYVSLVMSGEMRPKTLAARKKLRRVQVAIARKLGRPVDEVFPPDIAPAQPLADLAASA